MLICCNDCECVFNREGVCTYEFYMRALHGDGAFYIDEDGKCLRRAHKEKEKEEEAEE